MNNLRVIFVKEQMSKTNWQLFFRQSGSFSKVSLVVFLSKKFWNLNFPFLTFSTVSRKTHFLGSVKGTRAHGDWYSASVLWPKRSSWQLPASPSSRMPRAQCYSCRLVALLGAGLFTLWQNSHTWDILAKQKLWNLYWMKKGLRGLYNACVYFCMAWGKYSRVVCWSGHLPVMPLTAQVRLSLSVSDGCGGSSHHSPALSPRVHV